VDFNEKFFASSLYIYSEVKLRKNRDDKTLKLLLGAFAKLQRATVSFFISLSVLMKQLGFSSTGFNEIWY
jgi:hypothetical protein